MALNEEQDTTPSAPLQPEIKKPTRAKRTVVAKPTVSGTSGHPVMEELLKNYRNSDFTLDNNSDDNADLIQKKSKRKLKQSKNERQRQEKAKKDAKEKERKKQKQKKKAKKKKR
jgi:hypothetical protein